MLKMLLSCSLWLPLARSCSLRLPIALRICIQHPRSAHKVLAQLAAALQHFLLLWPLQILTTKKSSIAMMRRKQVLLEKLGCNNSLVKCIALFSIVRC